MLSTRDPPQNKRSIQTKSEGMEKKFHVNEHGKKKQNTGIPTLTSDNIDLKTKPKKTQRRL